MTSRLPYDSLLIRAADRAVSTKLPPIVRWRKIVRYFGPRPGERVSRKCFQSVAAALADYADRNGSSCWPSVATLAADVDWSERQVQYALASLEDWGLVQRDTRGGRGRSTRYELLSPRRVETPVGDPVDDDQLAIETVRAATQKGCDPSHPRSASEDRQIATALTPALATL